MSTKQLWTFKINYRPVDLKQIDNGTIKDKIAKNCIYWASVHSFLHPHHVHPTHPQEHFCSIFKFWNKTRATWAAERSLSHWSHFTVQLQASNTFLLLNVNNTTFGYFFLFSLKIHFEIITQTPFWYYHSALNVHGLHSSFWKFRNVF